MEKKNLRLYEKFQKVASESRACGLGENQKMMDRGLDENQSILIKT
jgi:hypothetical protein